MILVLHFRPTPFHALTLITSPRLRLGQGGLGVQKAKVEAISQVPQPTNVNQLRTFLGLCNYYEIIMKGFNNIAKLLTSLTQID